ncbi:unnamed protein product [Blepharisma stoltei]|uniref:Peptidase M14 domain-containing protein n=1 Tax=Blepharisma stoltei TaxID=1481888 RepID=A0AAU9I648_9CILI|nr:unnamed protein product [Blepharisma stoltei]
MKVLIYFLSALKFFASAFGDGSLDGYFTYSEIISFMQNLTSTFPGLARSGTIGKTYNGEDIHYLQLSTTSGLSQDQKTGIVITAAQFAGYPQGVSQVMFTAQEFSNSYSSDPNATFILSVSNIWLIPVINVDGYKNIENVYRESKSFDVNLKNLNTSGCSTGGGVNLDRNWGYKWDHGESSNDPCDPTYHGWNAFSEPETSALRSFIEDKNITLWVHYDRNGSYCTIPYTFSELSDFSVAEQPFYDQLYYSQGRIYSVGKAKPSYGSNEDGTLIDYAFSQGIFSLEIGINPHNSMELFYDYYNGLIEIMSLSNFYIDISYSSLYETSCKDAYLCINSNSSSYFTLMIDISNNGIRDALNLKLLLLASNPAGNGYTLSPTSLEMFSSWNYNYIPMTISTNSSYISMDANFDILAFSSIRFYLTVEKAFIEEADKEVQINYEWQILEGSILAYDGNNENLNISRKLMESEYYYSNSEDDKPYSKWIAVGIGFGIETIVICILIWLVCHYKKKLKESTRFDPSKNEGRFNGQLQFKPIGTPGETIDNSPQRFESPQI